MMKPVVSLQNVTKVFGQGGDNETVALKQINLEIHQSEFISLIGPSGCGKSTLLRLVGDLISPSKGTVLVNGKPAHQARVDQDYGIVFLAPVLYEWRSVMKNVHLPLELRWPLRMRRVQTSGFVILVHAITRHDSLHSIEAIPDRFHDDHRRIFRMTQLAVADRADQLIVIAGPETQ